MQKIAKTSTNFSKRDGVYKYTYWGKSFFECNKSLTGQHQIDLKDLMNQFNDVQSELKIELKRLHIPIKLMPIKIKNIAAQNNTIQVIVTLSLAKDIDANLKDEIFLDKGYVKQDLYGNPIQN